MVRRPHLQPDLIMVIQFRFVFPSGARSSDHWEGLCRWQRMWITAPVPAHAALPAVHIKIFHFKIITRFAVEQHEPSYADPEFTVA